MKLVRILSLLTCFLSLAIAAFGAQVNSETAAATVKGWLRLDRAPLGKSLGNNVRNVETFRDNAGVPLYHVVYLDPSGFVIVSAEDEVEPIIAFVEKGHFDPSPSNPLGALISRDVPARVAKARVPGANTSARLASRNKWQKLLQSAAGAPQPDFLTGDRISDVRVAPFLQTYWDQGNLLTIVTNLISFTDELEITTHFVTNSLGDSVTVNVAITNFYGNLMIITNGPGWPVPHSFSGYGVTSLDINNGPDNTVTNFINVTEAIQILVTNEFGTIISDQFFYPSVTVTNIVTGSPGATITSWVPATTEFLMVVSDLKACYNYFTPPSEPRSTNNYVCGCVATALAQLMYYFQYPATGVGTECFTVTVNGNPFAKNLLGGDYNGGPYNWKTMPLDPDYYSLTQPQAQAVGALTHDAGFAVHMQYSETGSGAYMTDAQAALVSTFKYSNAIENTVSNLDTGCFECSLYNMMNPNLDARLPVLLGISGDPGNHAIVVDGYGYSYGALYHHLNMGWGGAYNAWYSLPIIDLPNWSAPGVYSYFWDVTDCIYNVFTKDSGEIISGRVLDAGTQMPIADVTVTATGIGGRTYQIVTDTNGIYALVGVPSATSYTLTASDSGYFPASGNYNTGTSLNNGTNSGNVWGANFTLFAAVGPPIITTQPQGQTVDPGATATFSIAAEGQLPLSYQWQSGSGVTWSNLSDGGNFSGSATATLTVIQTSLGMNGEAFQCIVTNSSGITNSDQAVLSLNLNPPIITTQPQDQTVDPGATATFSIAAEGQLPLSYQWQSGSGITWSNLSDGGNFSGSATATLTVIQSGTNMNGEPFQCVVTNLSGVTTSAQAVLRLNIASVVQVATLAGLAGTGGSADGTSTSALFNSPRGIAVDSNTNVYVADMHNHTIRQLTLSGTNWVVTTIAGLAGNSGSADGTNQSARFNGPYGVAVDGAGNVYVADTGNSTIRKLTLGGKNWVVTTIAGLAGNRGSADGTNGIAQFHYPTGVAVDGNGNVYVADQGNHLIRMVAQAGTNWVVSTIAGLAGNSGSADGNNSAARFNNPNGVAVDGSGNVYVADTGNSTIRKISHLAGTNRIVSTIAGLANNSGSTDGIGSAAQFYLPTGIATLGSNTNVVVFVADEGNNAIRRLTPANANWVVFTVAGLAGNSGSTDGIGNAARFNSPYGVAVDNNTNIYVADTMNDIIRGGPLVAPPPAPAIIQMVNQQTEGTSTLVWNAEVGRTYQILYATNLNQATWSIFASVTPTNWTGITSIPIGPDPQRFYRVLPLP